MKLYVTLVFAILITFGPCANAQEAFRYYAPGDVISGSGRANDRTIYFPNISFPLSAGPGFNNAHAYANSQIHPISPPGNGIRNYAYPWRDTYCEERQWSMPLCPSKNGHQGDDIRPQDPSDDTWPVFAVADGVVVGLTHFTTLTIRSGMNDPYYCRYMHMNYDSILATGLKVGAQVHRGDRIGKVSNIMGDKPDTTIHLHFDCYKVINATSVWLPVYSSLISAYRRAWQLSDLNDHGELGKDPIREVGPSAPAVATAAELETGAIIPKSVRTKNYGAITPQTEPRYWPEYVKRWPDLRSDLEIRDAFGKVIPSFSTDEAGIGLWWYWMIKKGGFNPLGIVDFQSIALKYAGASSPDDPAVVTYLQGYTGTADHPGFSRLYFDRVVTATESLALSDPDVRWMIGQTMFHHEAGQRAPVDRETFDRGVVLGSRIIQTAAPAVLTSEADRPGAPRSDTSIQIDVGRYSVRFGNGVDLNLLSRVLTVLDGRQ